MRPGGGKKEKATRKETPASPDWYVYMLRCDDGSVYTGVSTDVARRLNEHQSGGARSARYLRTRRPVDVIFTQRVGERSAALVAEHAIKRLEKTDKERLARGVTTLDDVLARYAVQRARRRG
jgi:putative endonuclease